jgi:hypothetical protein
MESKEILEDYPYLQRVGNYKRKLNLEDESIWKPEEKVSDNMIKISEKNNDNHILLTKKSKKT